MGRCNLAWDGAQRSPRSGDSASRVLVWDSAYMRRGVRGMEPVCSPGFSLLLWEENTRAKGLPPPARRRRKEFLHAMSGGSRPGALLKGRRREPQARKARGGGASAPPQPHQGKAVAMVSAQAMASSRR
jgi:hypothetical protein